MIDAKDVIDFWVDQVGPKGWYIQDTDLDAKIKSKFESLWWDIYNGGHGLWLTYPNGALAYIIVTDQFSRNMFRGAGTAFGTDRLALAAAKSSIKRGWDLRITEPVRQFFYMPLMHSESLTDQDRAVRMFMTRMPDTGAGNLLHARAHREVIRNFGRFPGRNAALNRRATAHEAAYEASGGYGSTFQALAS